MWKLGLWLRNSFSGNMCFKCSILVLCSVESETHTQRQATQHGCLPILLADGDKVFKIGHDEKKYFELLSTKNRMYVFPEKELHGLNPNSYIHVSMCL
jgi:hypothetical protein